MACFSISKDKLTHAGIYGKNCSVSIATLERLPQYLRILKKQKEEYARKLAQQKAQDKKAREKQLELEENKNGENLEQAEK